ncbi:diacylglycerol kinase family protein [Craurococcus roseus]|uniref:Diacylglycerol kinase family protein n=1 Tax=Craurococcus roseus TaxID=77585 RepID=A0ABN1G5P5_9PROT
MERIGIIHNPLSRAGRDNRARFGAAAAGLPFAEPASRDALRDALRGFAARGVDLLAVQGGDGTLREVLTALPAAFGAAPPAIAVLAAGRTNLAAKVLGGAGTGEAALARLSDAAGRGALRRRIVPVLEVSRPGTEQDGGPLRGLLFGAAAFAEGKRIADERLHGRGIRAGPAVALALASVALRAGLDRRHPLRAGVPMAVAPDGRPPRDGRRFLLLATTLDRLMLGLRPFWGDGRGAVRWLDVEAPPRRLAAALWAGGRGRPAPWMAAAGYRSGRAERLEVAMDRPFVLDGEVFEPGPGGVLLSAPDRVAFVSP